MGVSISFQAAVLKIRVLFTRILFKNIDRGTLRIAAIAAAGPVTTTKQSPSGLIHLPAALAISELVLRRE